MEAQISSLLPSVSVPPDFPALLEISESPRRETQRYVWPSFAGLAFSRKADLKGFLSEAPQTVWSRNCPGTCDRVDTRTGAGKRSSKGQRRPTAEFWAVALKPARPCLSQTEGESPGSTLNLNPTCFALWGIQACNSQSFLSLQKDGSLHRQSKFFNVSGRTVLTNVSRFVLVGRHVHMHTLPGLSVPESMIYISKENSSFLIIDWAKIDVLHWKSHQYTFKQNTYASSELPWLDLFLY